VALWLSLFLFLLQVFEFLDSDLEALIKAKGVVLSAAHIKAYMQVGGPQGRG
jgi:hypothetical protein